MLAPWKPCPIPQHVAHSALSHSHWVDGGLHYWTSPAHYRCGAPTRFRGDKCNRFKNFYQTNKQDPVNGSSEVIPLQDREVIQKVSLLLHREVVTSWRWVFLRRMASSARSAGWRKWQRFFSGSAAVIVIPSWFLFAVIGHLPRSPLTSTKLPWKPDDSRRESTQDVMFEMKCLSWKPSLHWGWCVCVFVHVKLFHSSLFGLLNSVQFTFIYVVQYCSTGFTFDNCPKTQYQS